MTALPQPYLHADAEAQIVRIADSYQRLTGRTLVPPGADPVLALWEAPLVILAHGIEVDPLFFFGNRAAIERFETSLDYFLGSPSRFSAEEPLREERRALFDRVERDGFIDDYAGVRISAKGRRFRITQATVWTLIDGHGAVHGQAAAFDRWTELG